MKKRRALALLALLLWVAIAALVLVLTISNLAMLVLLVSALAVGLTGGWMAFSGRGFRLVAGWILAATGCAGTIVVILRRDLSGPFKGAIVVFIAMVMAYLAIARRVGLHPATHPTAPPPKKPWILVNPKSGGGRAVKAGLIERARELGIDVHVTSPGEDFIELAEAAVAAGADALGISGGDGSLGTVASVAMEHDLPFVCIAGGTRCHFALDVGLDKNDPLEGLGAFTDGVERRIDVATIGDRVFLNNASFGLYASMVAEPGYREKKTETARRVITEVVEGSRPLDALHFDTPDGTHFDEAAVILVGVNEYETVRLSELGTRSRLDGGVIQVNVLAQLTGAPLGLALAAAGIGAAGGRSGEVWKQWTSDELRIESDQSPVTVGVDGEFEEHPSPVVIKIHPKALRIRLPRSAGTHRSSMPRPADLWRAATTGDEDE